MKHKLTSIGLVFLACLLVSCGGGSGSGNEFNDEAIQYGPTAFYPFDETDGVIAYNSKFDAFHGDIVDASRAVGKIGNALDFSVTEGAHVLFDICCYADPNTGEGGMWVSFPNNSLTIAAWLKPTAMSMETIYPIFGGWYGSVQSMKLRINNGAVDFLLYPENNGAPITLITSASTLANEEWTHVALTFDGSHAVIYFNGIEDNHSDIIMPVEDIVNDYFIGGIPTSNSAGTGEHSFPGLIDEFLLSTTAFSQSEIAELVSEGN
jgi:hypothetical protein